MKKATNHTLRKPMEAWLKGTRIFNEGGGLVIRLYSGKFYSNIHFLLTSPFANSSSAS